MFTDILWDSSSISRHGRCQTNTNCKVNRHPRPSGIQQSGVLSIGNFQAPGHPLIIQRNQSSNELADAQTMADKSGMNVPLLFLHDVPNNWNQELFDALLGAILQVIKTLSFGEFRLSSIKDGEYSFRPMPLIREPRFTLEAKLVSLRDTEILFLKKWRGNQLRASRLGLG